MNFKKVSGVLMLSNITEVKLRALAEKREIYSSLYSKGATLHNKNEICDMLDIVMSGRLIAYSLSENGSAMTMFEFAKGSVIGANLLFGNKHEYPLNIYCVSDCEVLHIKKDAASGLLHDYNFTMEFIKSLSLNSLGMNQKITMMAQNTLRENLLEYFRQQSLQQNSLRFCLPINKKELADFLGVQRPSLFRELKRLKVEGIIQVENRTVTLLHSDITVKK